MNFIKTLDRMVNLDHVSSITYSTSPQPKATLHFATAHPKDGRGGIVTLEGPEAAKLIEDLGKMKFVSSGLSGGAAQQERERRQQQQHELAEQTKRLERDPLRGRKLILP